VSDGRVKVQFEGQRTGRSILLRITHHQSGLALGCPLEPASQAGSGMEASMTDVAAAPSGWCFDLQIPSIVRRCDGRSRAAPAQVPELLSSERSEAQTLVEPSVSECHVLRTELAYLKGQLPGIRRERNELRIELADLNIQISTLKDERDELLAAAVPLSAEVNELQSKQEELISLRSEIQALRRRKSWLEKSLTGLRRPTETARRGGLGTQTFHDS
jgi:hypothetical protein